MANPQYGQNKADNVINDITSKIKIKKFKIDFGVQAATTVTTESFAAGSIVLWWSAFCSETATSGGGATLQLGFTGTKQLGPVIVLAELASGKVHTSLITDSQPLFLNAADTFDATAATADFTAGMVDIEVYYLEPGAMAAGDGNTYITA